MILYIPKGHKSENKVAPPTSKSVLVGVAGIVICALLAAGILISRLLETLS